VSRIYHNVNGVFTIENRLGKLQPRFACIRIVFLRLFVSCDPAIHCY